MERCGRRRAVNPNAAESKELSGSNKERRKECPRIGSEADSSESAKLCKFQAKFAVRERERETAGAFEVFTT